MPGNKQGVDKELRSAQIQLRLAEIEEAYHVMRKYTLATEINSQEPTCA
jgi:hypothetical protein